MNRRYLLILGLVLTAVLYGLTTWRHTPENPDETTYYFIGQSNLKYLQQAFNPKPYAEFKAGFIRDHIVPCAMPVGKSLTHVFHTLFAWFVGPSFLAVARCNIIFGLGFGLILWQLGRILLRTATPEEGEIQAAGDNLPLIMLFLAAVSGIQLFYGKMVSPRAVSFLTVAATTAFYFAYLENQTLRRAAWTGLTASLATTGHLSTLPFIGCIFIVEALRALPRIRSGPSVFRAVQGLLVMAALLPAAHLFFQLVTWTPTLWIKDPGAWHFTAYYSLPFQTHFQQLAWYTGVVATGQFDFGGYGARFAQVLIVPAMIYGPVFILAAWGWLLALGRLIRRGPEARFGLLVLGPVIPVLYYTFDKDTVAAPYGMTPLGLFFTLLGALAIGWLLKVSRPGGRWRRGLAVLFLAGLAAAQTAHLYPMLTERGGYLEARDWLRARGENRIAVVADSAALETLGLEVYFKPGGWEEESPDRMILTAWGMRPDLTWRSKDFPNYLLLTYRLYLTQNKRAILATRGIDINRPLVHFDRFRARYYYPALYSGLAARAASALSPALGRRLERIAGFFRKRYHDSRIYIYRTGPYSGPGGKG